MDPKDKKPPVASAVVIKHSEFPDLILHGKRKDTNQWSIPGGHVHKDESLKDAAVRETKEETGLELNPDDLEHIGSEHYNTEEDKNLIVHLFVCKKPYHHESMDFTGDKDEEFKELKFINPLDHDDLYKPNGENIVVTYLKGELKKPEVKKAEDDYKKNRLQFNEAQKKFLETGAEGIATYKISPLDFLKLTTQNDDEINSIISMTKPVDFYDQPEIQAGITVAPHLEIDDNGKIVGHEGRHRAASALNAGINQIEIGIVANQSGWPANKHGWRWKRALPISQKIHPQFRNDFHHEIIKDNLSLITRDENMNIISSPFKKPEVKKAEDDYKGEHTAPTSTSGAPMHDLKNTYPGDIYSPEATRYYGHGVPYDNESISVIKNTKNKPNRPVKIYRAVPHVQSNLEQIQDLESQKAYILKHGKIPKHVTTNKDRSDYYDEISNKIEQLKSLPETSKEKLKINVGDWVTTSKKYAMEHGQANLGGRYKIISKTVPAKHLFTDGNSIHEWGYDPQVSKSEELDKDQGRISFKKLKVPSRPDQEVKELATPRQFEIAARSFLNRVDPKSSTAQKKIKTAQLQPSMENTLGGTITDTKGKFSTPFMNTNVELPTKKVDPRFIKEHEGFHHLMNVVREKYGHENAADILNNLISHIHPEDIKNIENSLIERGYKKPKNPLNSQRWNEEIINHVRDFVHTDLARKGFSKESGIRIKNAWKKIQRASKDINLPLVSQQPEKLASSEKSELKNLEVYQFFHDVTDDLIKVEIKDKNNLQAAEATFKIELGDIVVPEEVRVNDKHKTSDLAKEMYNYVNEIINLTKQELEKMSQPALRFKGLTKLPTRPEQDVKFISKEPLTIPSKTKEQKDIEELSGGPATISREKLESKKMASKILAAHPKTSKASKKIKESERKRLEEHISGGGDVSTTPEGTFVTSGYTAGFGDLPVSQPYEFQKPFPSKEGNVTQEHEATHHLLNHLRFKYGEDTKNRVVDHLLNIHLHPNEREAIEKLVMSKPSYKDLPEGEFNEEVLTHFRDLLVSKRKREEHSSLKRELPLNWQPIDYKRLKSSWKQLTNHAKKMTEKDLNKLMGKNEGQVDFEKLFKAKKLKPKQFKRFYLNRKKDHSGNTGSGIVAVGVQFPGGKCIVNWMTDTPSFNFYDSLEDIKEVHGHDGDTEINFMDDLNKAEEMKKFENGIEKFNSRYKYFRKDPLRKLPFLFLNKRGSKK